jgi:hypothetical protein
MCCVTLVSDAAEPESSTFKGPGQSSLRRVAEEADKLVKAFAFLGKANISA